MNITRRVNAAWYIARNPRLWRRCPRLAALAIRFHFADIQGVDVSEWIAQ